MAIKLRQSTAGQEIPLGQFVDADGVGTLPALANTDIRLWKMGATALVNKNSGGATVMANSMQVCTLDATDTDTLGGLVVCVFVAGSLPVQRECEVLAANVYDAWIVGNGGLIVGSVTGAVGSVAGSVAGSVGSVVGSVASVAGAVGSIGANGITGASLAADAGTEIAAAVLAAAAADPIDANVEQINAVAVQGAGILGDKWRPV